MKSKFFCDIRGTYSGECDRDTELKTLVYNLTQLDSNDELSFSFITTEDMEDLKKDITEFSKYIEGTKITMGRQYSLNTCLEHNTQYPCIEGKNMQILKEIASADYDRVYYADDCELYHKMAIMVLNKKNIDVDFVSIIPKGGITNLNEKLGIVRTKRLKK